MYRRLTSTIDRGKLFLREGAVAECTYCKAETHFYDLDIPVCVDCARRNAIGKPSNTDPDVRTTLVQELSEATARAESASETFNAVMGNVPSGIPHPDGVQRLHNASREMSNARQDLTKAHHRLNEFIERGTIPEDLKGSGKD
jgi:hypothetical protein